MTTTIDPMLKIALEAQTKAMFAELDKRFEARDEKWEKRFLAIESAAAAPAPSPSSAFDQSALDSTAVQGELEAVVAAHMLSLEVIVSERLDQYEAASTTRVAALESAAAAFESWRPRIETAVDDIKDSVDSVKAEFVKFHSAWNRDVLETNSAKPSIFGNYESASARPPAGDFADGPNGHRVEHHRRESGFGRSGAQSHLPHNGTPNHDHPKFSRLFGSPHDSFGGGGRFRDSSHSGSMGKLPTMNFPKFDGDNPRLWIRRSEDYFEMYGVESNVWIMVASSSSRLLTGSVAAPRVTVRRGWQAAASSRAASLLSLIGELGTARRHATMSKLASARSFAQL